MKLTVIVHEAIEGGYWAEVPAIPGCATEGDSWDELISNLHEAIEGCLSIDRLLVGEGGFNRDFENYSESVLQTRAYLNF
jgi:predicted RNase H-like HicB family nuclease